MTGRPAIHPFPPYHSPIIKFVVLALFTSVFLAGCSSSKSPSTASSSASNSPEEEIENKGSIEEIRSKLGMSPDLDSDLDVSNLSTQPKSSFRILSRGSVTLESYSEDLPFPTLELKPSGEDECVLTEKEKSDRSIDLRFRWNNGTLLAYKGDGKQPAFRVEPKPGKVILQPSGNGNKISVRTTAKSVNVYIKEGSIDQLICKMESFPSRWQLNGPTGEKMGSVSTESGIGVCLDGKDRVLAEAEPIGEALGLAFVPLNSLPIEHRIALCIYFHQE